MKNKIRYINLNMVSPEMYLSLWEYDNVIDLNKPTILKFNTEKSLVSFWQGPYFNNETQEWNNKYSDLSDYFNSVELSDIFKLRLYEKVEIPYNADISYYVEGPDVVNFLLFLPHGKFSKTKELRRSLSDKLKEILDEILKKRNIKTVYKDSEGWSVGSDMFFKVDNKYKKFLGMIYRLSVPNFSCISFSITYNFESDIADRIRHFDSKTKVKKFDVDNIQDVVGGLYEICPDIDRENVENEYINEICTYLNLSAEEYNLTSREERELFERGRRRLTDKEWYLYGNNDGFT